MKPDPNQPVLPYGGNTNPNSGHSGSNTSKTRAETEDADGTTKNRQRLVLALLANQGTRGVTFRELGQTYGWHHGQSSGTLSNLHKAGLVERLSENRSRCKVYVLPEYVNDRQIEAQGQTATTLMLAQAVDLLNRLTNGECRFHQGFTNSSTCVLCETQEVIRRYEATRRRLTQYPDKARSDHEQSD